MIDSNGTADAPQAAPLALPIDKDAVGEWKNRIKKSQTKKESYVPWWDKARDDYAVSVKESPEKYSLVTRTNRSFATVERKIADLFYQRPDVTVSPSALLDQMPQGAQCASIHADILNSKLGQDGIDGEGMATQAIFDYLLFGCGPTKMGYRAYTKDVLQDVPVLDPITQQPQTQPVLDPLTQMPQTDQMGMPVTQPVTEQKMVPVPVKTVCYWDNMSVKQLLLPHDLKTTDYDKAAWLGMRFEMPLLDAKRMWAGRIPPDWKPAKNQKSDSKDKFDDGVGEDGSADDTVFGTEIFYKSNIYREDVEHPDRLTQLVMLDGLPDPVEHRDSPDQTVDEMGKLSPDSLIGFPIHPLTIRVLSDSSRVMSDVAIGLPQTQEMDKFREQGTRQRDTNLVRFLYNSTKIPKSVIDDIVVSPLGGLVGVPDEVFQDFNGAFRQLPQGAFPPEAFPLDAQHDADYSRTFAVDATTSGASDPNSQTATEANLRQANVNVRMGKEQNRVAKWWLKGVRKFSTIIQRYMTVAEAAEIVGMQNAMLWDSWRKSIPTALAFTMEPDSSLRNDTPLDRKQAQDFYTYMANEPRANKRYLLEKLLLKYHIDPSKGLMPEQQLPQPKPDPKDFSGDIVKYLDPTQPMSPIAMDLWNKIYPGAQISPDVVNTALQWGMAALAMQKKTQTDGKPDDAHGGKLAQSPSLDKHAVSQTGGMNGTGALGPGLSPNIGGMS